MINTGSTSGNLTVHYEEYLGSYETVVKLRSNFNNVCSRFTRYTGRVINKFYRRNELSPSITRTDRN